MTSLDPGTAWRGLSGPFTCTGCGTQVLFDSGGPMQTLDGAQKLCRTCTQKRIDAAWAAKPDGVYAVHLRDHTGVILSTDYVLKGSPDHG